MTTLTDMDLLEIALDARARARTFMRESGNTPASVCARAHDIAIDEILARGGDTTLYLIKTSVIVDDSNGEWTPWVDVERKDVVTLLGERA